MNYYVAVLHPDIEPLYEEFLEQLSIENEFILAYHHLSYRDVLQASLGDDASSQYQVIIERGAGPEKQDRIVAALPCFVKNSSIGTAYCSLPFFGPNAGVLCSLSHPDAYTWHKMLLQAAVEDASASNALSITFYTPLRFSNFQWYEEMLGPDFKFVDKFTQHMEITNPPVWGSKISYDIRCAERAGLQVVAVPSSDHADQFWSLYIKNCSNYGIPSKPKACFNAILEKMRPRGLAHFYVAVDPGSNGRVVAGLLNIMSRRTVSYFMPAYDASYRNKQPMALLIHKAYSDAAIQGRTLWNWESSPSRESGVYAYKARWGSRESGFRIYVKPLRTEKEFTDLGQNKIESNFPYFFVYPFKLL